MKKNYYDLMIEYLEKNQKTFITCAKMINRAKDYYERTYNKNSCTDNDCFRTLENAVNLLEYESKYINVIFDFYGVKSNNV